MLILERRACQEDLLYAASSTGEAGIPPTERAHGVRFQISVSVCLRPMRPVFQSRLAEFLSSKDRQTCLVAILQLRGSAKFIVKAIY